MIANIVFILCDGKRIKFFYVYLNIINHILKIYMILILLIIIINLDLVKNFSGYVKNKVVHLSINVIKHNQKIS